MSKAHSMAGPTWALAVHRLFNYLSRDFLGGPRICKFSWVINFQKTGTFLFLGLLMLWYDANSTPVWVYLALHGTYGFVWFLKDMAFPDPSWQQRITIGGAIVSFAAVLGPYWLFGWLLISAESPPSYPLPEQAWYALCITLCMFGSALMIAADAQKFFTLRLSKGLITDGVHRYIRHPNYLGEMMIYASFALMVWHWIPFVVLVWVWGAIFTVNMIVKEARMSRYPNWNEYKRNSWWLIPWII